MDGVTRDWLGHFRPNENALTMVECDMIGEHGGFLGYQNGDAIGFDAAKIVLPACRGMIRTSVKKLIKKAPGNQNVVHVDFSRKAVTGKLAA